MNPADWKYDRFKTFAVLQRGIDLVDNELKPGPYPVVKSNGIDGWHEQCQVKGPGVTTGRSGTIGNAFYIEQDFWPHNTCLYVKDFRGNNQKYIYYLISSMNFERFSAGTSVPTLNRNDIHAIKVAIPDTPEQKRIAALLALTDEVIAATQASVDAAQKLKRGLMQNLLTGKLKPDGTWRREDEFDIDPKFGRAPKGWRWTRVKESLVEQPTYGANASAIPYHSDMARFIRITDIDDEGNLIVEDKTSIDVPAGSDYVLQDGDIVIARTGDTVGKSLLFRSEYGFCAYAGYLIRLRFDETKCLSDYFDLVLHADLFEAFKIAMQRVGAKPNINAREYANFAFPKPESTDDQQTIVAVGNSLANVVRMRKEKLTRLQNLKKALMQNLLTGKVRIPPDLKIE